MFLKPFLILIFILIHILGQGRTQDIFSGGTNGEYIFVTLVFTSLKNTQKIRKKFYTQKNMIWFSMFHLNLLGGGGTFRGKVIGPSNFWSLLEKWDPQFRATEQKNTVSQQKAHCS